MSWKYSQATGIIRQGDDIKTCGYSGNGIWKNKPSAEAVHNHGPIPKGKWKMVKLVEQHEHLGHYVIVLEPEPGTETYSRFGLCWHGENPAHPGQSSDGCIVSGLDVRIQAWNSPDRDIEVTE